LGAGAPGVFVVLPGCGHVAEVECLPSREGVHLGEQTGEWFPGAGSEAVRGELVDLVDLGVEFVADDDGTELPVESADGVELLVQECDGRAVDAPGGIE
jgi:hypothetical protein